MLARTGQIEVAQMRWAKMLKLQLLLTLTNRVHRAEGPQEISSRCYWCQHEMQVINISKEYELFVSGNITSATGDSRASRAARQTSSSMPTSSRFSEVINDDNINDILSSSTMIAYLGKATFQDLQLANCCELCRRSWRPFAGSCLLRQVLIQGVLLLVLPKKWKKCQITL